MTSNQQRPNAEVHRNRATSSSLGRCYVFWSFVFSSFAFLSLGCNANSITYEVSGQVLVDDQPAEGIYVVFRSMDDTDTKKIVTARSDVNGQFNAKFPIAGRFGLRALLPSQVMDEGEPIEGPDQFQGKYNSKEPFITVEISEPLTDVGTLKLVSKGS